jgi:hypothetical protein
MKILLSKLWAHNFQGLAQTAVSDAARCLEYARMETPRSPIEVCRGNPDQIFNGYHRVVAASFRGETEIEAEVFPRSEHDFAFW